MNVNNIYLYVHSFIYLQFYKKLNKNNAINNLQV